MPPKTEHMPQQIQLPAVVKTILKTPLGRVWQVLQAGRTENVADTEEVRVSRRKFERLVTLESGQKIVCTERRSCPAQLMADGVLWTKPGATPQWLDHALLRQAAENDVIDAFDARTAVSDAWKDQLRFRSEEADAEGNVITPGLRPPQLGALHAIGAHWSIHSDPATIVMPTGTGKTETMIAALVAMARGPVLVVVPSVALRNQTAAKFETLGLLRQLGVIPEDLPNPIVGVIEKRPQSEEDIEFLDRCNVVISTMSALSQGTAVPLIPRIAAKVGTLIVDETHHVAARTWSGFREQFANRRVLQFTATPYRRDGQLVDGDVIYTYPLRRAQEDGYFTPISFKPVYEFDQHSADRAIAEAAIGVLKEDFSNGWNHAMMARCETIARAEEVHAIYEELAPEYEPLLVHSESSGTTQSVARLRRRKQNRCLRRYAGRGVRSSPTEDRGGA